MSVVERAALLALLGFGIAMRVWILVSPFGGADSDEAVVGLMARGFLHGDIKVYFWGQSYGGSQEALIAAVVFLFAGPSTLALKSVPLLLSVVATVLIHRIGLKTVGAAAARWGAMFFWSAPFAFVWLSTKERGFYGSTMVCGLVIVLCALHLVERDDKRYAVLLAFAAGLGVWASPQVAYLMLPTLAWLIARRPQVLRLLPIALPAFVLGAFPAIVYNVGTGVKSLDVPTIPMSGSYLDRVQKFFDIGLPMFLGVKVPYVNNWTTPGAVAVYLVVLGAIGVGLSIVVRKRVRSPVALLVLIAAAYPFIFALSPYSAYIREPRYIYFFAAPASLLLAYGLRRNSLRIAWGALSCVLCVASMNTLLNWPEKYGNKDLASENLGALISSLDNHNERYVFGDYWVAYRLSLVTDEHVIAAPTIGDRENELLDNIDRQNVNSVYVVFSDTRTNRLLPQTLDARRIAFTREDIGRLSVYRLDREQLPAAFDRDIFLP